MNRLYMPRNDKREITGIGGSLNVSIQRLEDNVKKTNKKTD